MQNGPAREGQGRTGRLGWCVRGDASDQTPVLRRTTPTVRAMVRRSVAKEMWR